jgi:glutamine---fructose-6-phosphate transaminase (isomerizing)
MSITNAEIASQPAVWERALSDVGAARRVLGSPGERVLFLGCGTSEFVSESLAILRERSGLGESDAAYASEWRPGRQYDRVIALSRSGTTSEVLDVLDRIPSGPTKVAITGVADAPIHELVDDALILEYADEESVVQTRFPTTVIAIARAVFGEDVSGLPAAAAAALAQSDQLALSDQNGVGLFDHFVYLGSGWTYGLAQEGSLKIREAAQAWSESYPLFEYRHGPIAVAHPGSLVTIFGDADPEIVADIERTGAVVRSGPADPLVQLVTAQRLAVQLAESRGLDPDHPRHLTRSVILHA